MAVRLLITACLLFVLFRGVFAAYRFGHDAFYQQSVEAAPGRDIAVHIPEGQSTAETAKQLKELGLIENTWAFRLQSLFLGRKVRAGEYSLNTSETIDDMLEILSAAPEKRGGGNDDSRARPGLSGLSGPRQPALSGGTQAGSGGG